MTITADKKTATHKSQVVITCVAFGYPKPEFTFHYVNGSTETVVSDADSRTTGVLNISSVPFDGNYKAIYKCIPSNKLGNGDVKNVSVEVEGN